jgi:hypothetical protein
MLAVLAWGTMAAALLRVKDEKLSALCRPGPQTRVSVVVGWSNIQP